MKKIPQDIVGDIAILKFPRRTLWLIKKLKARKFLKENKTLKTVVEKVEGFSGELRTLKTKHLAGIKTREATYKENQCTFKFNIDEAYFSPRLSNERKVIADEIVKLCKKKNTKILVMFAGIAPYPIIIAKKLKQAGKHAIIISNELNKKANESARKNIAINKLSDYITLVDGDAKKLPTKLRRIPNPKYKFSPLPQIPNPKSQIPCPQSVVGSRLPPQIPNPKSQIPDNIETFDIILMPRPNLEDTFLKTALKLSKKGTVIFYHGFGTKEEILNEIKNNTRGRIGKVKIRKAGDIGAYKYRWQASFKIK